MVLDLTIEQDALVDQLSREIVTGGLTVVDTVERLLGEHIEDSIQRSLAGRLTTAPRATVYPLYYMNRFENLATLAREGYSTWYPEVRFTTRKDSDRYKVSTCTQPRPVFCGSAWQAHGKVVAVSILRAMPSRFRTLTPPDSNLAT